MTLDRHAALVTSLGAWGDNIPLDHVSCCPAVLAQKFGTCWFEVKEVWEEDALSGRSAGWWHKQLRRSDHDLVGDIRVDGAETRLMCGGVPFHTAPLLVMQFCNAVAKVHGDPPFTVRYRAYHLGGGERSLVLQTPVAYIEGVLFCDGMPWMARSAQLLAWLAQKNE